MSEAEKRLRTQIGIQRDLGMKGHSWDNYTIARDTLHQELGYNGEAERHPGYSVDNATRDVLIVHGRQDAAHALSNTTSLLSEVERMRRQLGSMFWMNVATLGVVVWLVWHR